MKKLPRTLAISLMACLGLALSACSKTPQMTHIEGYAQGTSYHISYQLADQGSPEEIEKAVAAELQRIDDVFSNYRDDSLIEQFNAQITTAPIAVDPEIVALVEEARKVYKASNGCYDLTIKPLFDLWGFKKDVFSPPDAETLASTLDEVGMNKLETLNDHQLRKTNPQLRVDISSIGQGYSVARVAELLRKQYGVTNYMVEIGGELQAAGNKADGSPWRIALEKPLPNERKLQKIVQFNSGAPLALMTSGTYRHFFDSNGKRYSHILDARSGKPVEHDTVSVTVLHPNPTVADAWSTALNCLGSGEGMQVANDNGIAVLFIDQKGDQLIESESKPLEQMKDVSFTQP